MNSANRPVSMPNSTKQSTLFVLIKKIRSFSFLLFILLIISVVGFVWAYTNYQDYKNKLTRLSTPEGQQELVMQETSALVAKVAKHIVLPTDEDPTVATILDAEGLAKDQPFYQNAKNGDKVLIYVKAQKAIVYRESEDVLVNVGPVYIEKDKQQSDTSVQQEVMTPTEVSGSGE